MKMRAKKQDKKDKKRQEAIIGQACKVYHIFRHICVMGIGTQQKNRIYVTPNTHMYIVRARARTPHSHFKLNTI